MEKQKTQQLLLRRQREDLRRAEQISSLRASPPSLLLLLLVPSFLLLLLSSPATSCAPPGFIQSSDPAFVNARCSDLILYPVAAVDQSDQYRFDYSDVSFGNTHSQGATVAITCTTEGQPATVEGYDQQRASITASPSLLATCTNVGGSQFTWTILGRILQFVDCRF